MSLEEKIYKLVFAALLRDEELRYSEAKDARRDTEEYVHDLFKSKTGLPSIAAFQEVVSDELLLNLDAQKMKEDIEAFIENNDKLYDMREVINSKNRAE